MIHDLDPADQEEVDPVTSLLVMDIVQHPWKYKVCCGCGLVSMKEETFCDCGGYRFKESASDVIIRLLNADEEIS